MIATPVEPTETAWYCVSCGQHVPFTHQRVGHAVYLLSNEHFEIVGWLRERIRGFEEEVKRLTERADGWSDACTRESARAEKAEASARAEASAAQTHFEAWQRLEARLAELKNRTLEQVISEEWRDRGIYVIETYDGKAKRWVIQARDMEDP